MALNDKQKAFIDEYQKDCNATQAAIRAGYSERTAYSQGQRLLKNVEVSAALTDLEDARQERTGITADRVVEELGKLGFATMRDVATWDEHGVRFLNSNELTEDAAAAIKSVKSVHTTTEDGHERVTREITLHDKVKPLELLGKRFGIFTDRVQVGGDGDNPIEIQWDT